jgi:transcriptional regulator of heat shock response
MKKNDLKTFEEILIEKIKQEVIKEIADCDKTLIGNFTETYQETIRMIENFQETFWDLNKKMKKIVDSGSLYEDVYKMRDELIEIKKLLEKQKKLNNFISD